MHLAKIYKQNDFDAKYQNCKRIYPDDANFLDESDFIGRWTQTYSSRSCNNIMTTNGVKSINARLHKERQLPIS